MACSGVWIEPLENGGLRIGVTDYHVSEFGDSDWEWSAEFDKKNIEILEKNLRKEFGNEMSIEEMVAEKFGRNLNTIEFTKYCDKLKIDYEIRRFY